MKKINLILSTVLLFLTLSSSALAERQNFTSFYNQDITGSPTIPSFHDVSDQYLNCKTGCYNIYVSVYFKAYNSCQHGIALMKPDRKNKKRTYELLMGRAADGGVCLSSIFEYEGVYALDGVVKGGDIITISKREFLLAVTQEGAPILKELTVVKSLEDS